MDYSSRRSSTPKGPLWAAVIAVVLVGGIILWYGLRPDPEPGPDRDLPAFPADTAAEDTLPVFTGPDVEPLDLPELEGSDAFVRDLVAGLSSHPQLARWLVTDGLVDRYVSVVLDLAGGSSPVEHVEFLRPDEPFEARRTDGDRGTIDPESYRRWDLLAETFASLDVEGTVRLHRQLRPLIEEAWEARGIPDLSFDHALARALNTLRDTEVPQDPPEVVLVDGIWEFADPELEALSGAQKVLIRMGPENAARVKAQVNALASEMGLN